LSATCNEEGLVTASIKNNRVKVVVKRGEACGSCASKGACQTLGGPTKDLILVLDNSINAEPGDTVRLTMAESAVVKASAVLYLVPALFLIAGALLGFQVAKINDMQTDPLAIFGSIGGLALGMFTSWLLGKKLSKNRSFIPQLTAIVGHVNDDLVQIEDNIEK